MPTVNIFWFRRDLRLSDNAGLYHALQSENPVVPIFIFDKNILDKLEDKADRRVEFILAAIHEIQDKLQIVGSSLEVFYGTPEEAFKTLLSKYKIDKVFANNDYEPYAMERESAIAKLLKAQGSSLLTYKDQVIFEKAEVIKDNGAPYTVYTPYSKKWKSLLTDFHLKPYLTKKYFKNFYQQSPKRIPSLTSMGFTKVGDPFPSKELNEALVTNYAEKRDFPGIAGTSKMGVHLRFGTISIRELAANTKELSAVYLNELIWRDFYQMILWHFPQIGQGKAFKPAYDNIKWQIDNGEFEKWCNGQTGYPIVDAGMRQLNKIGFMHNRVRMITASFLTKHLLLDWRLGEAYFAKKLLDYDFAANNGGWQWAAGSGWDAAPYFRIFNPRLQTEKFDKKLEYIHQWVPELESASYPKPIVDHEFARKRCLEEFGKAVKKFEQ
ncbi:MAG: deoxyribodipyrimidine photo-lyase [Ferruginibacter sp.]|nr:deoxyribodipyrimidine photo-lyase [Ferruginibacter sp.]